MKTVFTHIRRAILTVIGFLFVYFTYFRKATLIVIALLLAGIVLPSVLLAEQNYPDNWDEDYPLMADEMPLEDALKLFGRNLRIGVVIDADIEKTNVRAMSGTQTGISYLETLAYDFGLNWYFDGGVLRVFPVGETETRVIPLKDRYAEEVVDSLVELGVYQPRFLHMAGEQAQTLRVTAPREYLDLVSRTVEAIELSRQVDVRIRRAGVIVDYQGIPPTSGSQDSQAADVAPEAPQSSVETES